MKKQFIKISKDDLLELIHWARRYCDGRMTGVPSAFNKVYDRVCHENYLVCKDEINDSHVCKYFPIAQDGQYDEKTGMFNAIKTEKK